MQNAHRSWESSISPASSLESPSCSRSRPANPWIPPSISYRKVWLLPRTGLLELIATDQYLERPLDCPPISDANAKDDHPVHNRHIFFMSVMLSFDYGANRCVHRQLSLRCSITCRARLWETSKKEIESDCSQFNPESKHPGKFRVVLPRPDVHTLHGYIDPLPPTNDANLQGLL